MQGLASAVQNILLLKLLPSL